MKTTIERPVTTCGKDENIMSMVVFPCNEEDLKERFQVSDLARELKFVDVPESKVSIPRFNGLVLDSPSRGAKLEEQINAAVRYLEERTPAGKSPVARQVRGNSAEFCGQHGVELVHERRLPSPERESQGVVLSRCAHGILR